MNTIGERVKSARNEAGLSITALARACGVSYAAVHQWESGATKGGIKPENLAKAAAATGVLMHWLATGEGPRKAMQLPVGLAVETDTALALTPRQQALLGLFDGLTDSQQEAYIRELEGAKQKNDELLEELLRRRKGA